MQILQYGTTYKNIITCDTCNCKFVFENADLQLRDNKKQFSFFDADKSRTYAIVSDVQGTVTDSEWFGPVALYEVDTNDDINVVSEKVYIAGAEGETVELEQEIVKGDFDPEFDDKVIGKYAVQDVWVNQDPDTEPIVQVAGQSFSKYVKCPCCGKEFGHELCYPWKNPLPDIEPEPEAE